MSKKKPTKRLIHGLRALAVVLGVVGVVGASSVLIVYADRFAAQINALRAENSANAGAVNSLAGEANDYKAVISQKQAQINALRAQINANQAKQSQLEQQIEAHKQEIATKKASLASDIKSMYVDGQMTTIEQLATSKDLSDYVDKEEYRTSVQNQLNAKIKEIAGLQAQLQDQKKQVDQVIATTKAQNDQLASEKAEQDKLLAYNEGQQAAYNQQISQNSGKIAELKRQQAQENIRLFGGSASGGTIGGGGYPWGSATCLHTGRVDGPCPNYDWAVGGNLWSPYGYGYRNCTDWVAYRAGAPAGLGNANTWDDRAPSYGYGVGSTPRAGAAAVSNSGAYGHVMYVEAVHGNGSITVSDYNKAGTGKYDSYTISAGTAASLRYVYFR